MFGRATITLSIGPHSSFVIFQFLSLSVFIARCELREVLFMAPSVFSFIVCV